MKKIAILVLVFSFVFTFAAIATGQKADTSSDTGKTMGMEGKYNESPMLKAKVDAGVLESVDERLPLEPKVISPDKNEIPQGNVDFKIGKYGGTLKMVRTQPTWHANLNIMMTEQLVNTPSLMAEEIGGDICKDYKVSDDGKVFTFYMREGLKWSDGEPVTSEDVLFTYEDYLLNDKLTATFPVWMKSGNRPEGEPLKLEVIDTYTFRISFAVPYEGFPMWLAIIGWNGYQDFLKPKHFLKDFHIRYTPIEKLEPLIKEADLTAGEWWTLFNLKDITRTEVTHPNAIGFPLLAPWIPVEATTTRMTYERNPYYFKVDSEGNQLPYIDYIHSNIVADEQTKILKIIAGETDYEAEEAMANLPLFKENEDAGGYEVVLLKTAEDPVNIQLNHTFSNPDWRTVVRDSRFRKALSLAINRDEIIDAVYYGFAKPSTIVPNEYDPDEANKLLDEMGLVKRDADGYRLGPDGNTFVIPFEIVDFAADFAPVTELVIEYFKNVGIKATMKVVAGSLWFTRAHANELQAAMFWNMAPLWWGWGGTFGYNQIDRFAWILWSQWWTSGGEMGEEPPEDVKRFLDLRAASVVVSREEAAKFIEEFTQLQYENLYFIQIVGEVPYCTIVSKKLGNVPFQGFAIESTYSGEQFFFKE